VRNEKREVNGQEPEPAGESEREKRGFSRLPITLRGSLQAGHLALPVAFRPPAADEERGSIG
jgi:hypothetical protein